MERKVSRRVIGIAIVSIGMAFLGILPRLNILGENTGFLLEQLPLIGEVLAQISYDFVSFVMCLSALAILGGFIIGSNGIPWHISKSTTQTKEKREISEEERETEEIEKREEETPLNKEVMELLNDILLQMKEIESKIDQLPRMVVGALIEKASESNKVEEEVEEAKKFSKEKEAEVKTKFSLTEVLDTLREYDREIRKLRKVLKESTA